MPTVIHTGSSAKIQIHLQEQKMRMPSATQNPIQNPMQPPQGQKLLGRDTIRIVSSESKTVGRIGRGKEVSVNIELAHLVFEDSATHKKLMRPPRVFVIISCGRGQIILNVDEAKAMVGMLSGVLPDAIYHDRMLLENKDDRDSNLKN
jgi:hypothetical protein